MFQRSVLEFPFSRSITIGDRRSLTFLALFNRADVELRLEEEETTKIETDIVSVAPMVLSNHFSE